MEKATEQITLRVTKSFRERLEAQAVKERRNRSNLIIKVLEEYLDEQEQNQE